MVRRVRGGDVQRVLDGEMVLLRCEQYLRLYREILGDPEIHKPTELRTDTHVGVHRVVVTRDEEVIEEVEVTPEPTPEVTPEQLPEETPEITPEPTPEPPVEENPPPPAPQRPPDETQIPEASPYPETPGVEGRISLISAWTGN